MHPALGVSSGCVFLRYASEARAVARNAAGSSRDTRNTADSRISPVSCSRLLSYANAIAMPGTSSATPSRDARRASATISPISRPPKCALPKIAPPTVPGVPAHASRPAQPRLIVHRTSPLIVTAPSARTCVSFTSPISPPRGRITSPRTPASATSTFDPPPSIVTGNWICAASRSAVRISSLLRGSNSQSAAPPTRNVVSGASGAAARSRSSPKA